MLVTRELVGEEAFAVILSDDVIDAEPPALKQMIDVYDQVQGPVLCVERVPREDISSYGVIAYEPDASLPNGVYRVTDLVEKPPRGAGAVGPGHHRPLHPDAGHLRRRSRRPPRTAPARFS